MPFSTRSSGLTDVGCVRKKNEDSYIVDDRVLASGVGLYVVADGMGGHAAGEVASQEAVETVFGIAEQDPARRGMGTTISTLLVTDRFAYVASVGDSRAYLVRDGIPVQITEDHTLVNMQLKAGAITKEQAKTLPYSNLITRAVGVKDYVEVDTFEVECRAGDRFMLCSDGLHGYIDDPAEIAGLLNGQTLDAGAIRFIDLANGRGGKDNITVVIVETVDG